MGGDRVVTVRAATSPAELDRARVFFRAFVAWHRERHAEDLGLIDRYFDSAGFERELAGRDIQQAAPGRLQDGLDVLLAVATFVDMVHTSMR